MISCWAEAAKGRSMGTSTTPTIRRATEDDVPALTRIYNEGIVDRIATLETEERSEAERRAWLTKRDARHPVFVAERDGAVAGWVALNAFNPRAAYRFVGELSVYVGRGARGEGVGRALLTHLIAEARALGYHKLVLCGFPFNQAAMRLYEAAGFREVGIYHEQGVLNGRWVDTIIMELLLDNNPPPRD